MTLDHHDVEAVAERVVELLRETGDGAAELAEHRLVDAATVARVLGISRGTVYAKARELGGIRVGTGKRARIRFDLTQLPALGPADPDKSPAVSPVVRPSHPRKAADKDRQLLPIVGGRKGSRGPLRS